MSNSNKLIHNIDDWDYLRIGDRINNHYVVLDIEQENIVLSSPNEEESILIVEKGTNKILTDFNSLSDSSGGEHYSIRDHIP